MHRRSIPAAGLVAALVLGSWPQLPTAQSRSRRDHERINGYEAAADRVIVKMRRGASRAAADDVARQAGGAERRGITNRGVMVLRSARMRAAQLVAALAAHPAVEYVEPDYVVYEDAIPDDTGFGQQWGLLNRLVPGADIGATDAWNLATGSSNVVIGITDSAVDMAHTDLRRNAWTAPRAFTVSIGGFTFTCPAGSHGVRSDSLVFCDTSAEPGEDHGTHVAGIAGASGNNAQGTAGVSWDSSLMTLAFMRNGIGYLSDAIQVMEAAIQVKSQFAGTGAADVRVINASWTVGPETEALREQIAYLAAHDVLFVASASNDGRDLDQAPTYPASYQLPNTITVGASTINDGLASFSNYGRNSVHLVAPGQQIYSTVPGGWATFDGTSMAAPFVSGAAGLVLSRCPMSAVEAKQLLLDTLDRRTQFQPYTIYGGRLNVGRALQVCAASAPPAAPAVKLTAPLDGTTYVGPASVLLEASASDTDGSVLAVEFYSGATLLGTDTAAPYRATWTGVTQGTYRLRAVAVDSSGLRRESNAAAVTVSAGTGWPIPWVSTGVGTTGLAGSASLDNGRFTVNGAGTGIGGAADAFHFAHQSASGDIEFVARVTSVANTGERARAGIMLRESLAADSHHATVSLKPTGDIEVVSRLFGTATVTPGPRRSAPVWLKLARNRGTVGAYYSADGRAWTFLASQSAPYPATVRVGLVSTSGSSSVLGQAVFDNVALTAVPPLGPPEKPRLPEPADGATGVPTKTLLRWTAPGAATYEIRLGPVNPPPGTGVTELRSPYFTPSSLTPNTRYFWQVVARNGAGTTAGPVWSFTTAGASLWPSTWTSADIGTTGRTGSASFASGRFTVAGAGADVWSAADSFRYVYQPLTGDGQIVTRVESLQNTHAYAKAGVMIRQALTTGSAHVTLDVRPGGAVEFMTRRTAGGTTAYVAGAMEPAPVWLKLQRRGSTFTASVSRDGSTWTTIGTTTTSLATSAYVGLLVCSHDTSVLNTAVFDQVSVTKTPAVPASPSPANGATAVPTSASLAWTAPGAVSYDVRLGTTSTPPTVASNRPTATFTPASLAANTKYYWQIVARNGAGTTTGPVWSFTTAGTTMALPGPWTARDIGATGRAGSASIVSGRFTVTGAGADVWGATDSFHYVYQTLGGDGQIVARVQSLQNTHAYAKAGVMIRESAAADAAHVTLDVRPGGAVEFMTRRVRGGTTTFLGGQTRAAPVWLKLQRSGSTITASVSADGVAWTVVGTTTTALPSSVLAGLVVCSHDTAHLNTAVFEPVSISSGLPAPWTSTDLGSTGQAGSAAFGSGRFTVTGAGADIWGAADGFHYVHQPFTGDGQVVARVESLQNTHPYAKAGITIRDSLAPDAAHVTLDVRPGGGIEFMTRRARGAGTTFVAGRTQAAPVWLKLRRSGTTITASVSTDGTTWVLVGTTISTLSSRASAGLVVCSHDTSRLSTAVFTGVAVAIAPQSTTVLTSLDDR